MGYYKSCNKNDILSPADTTITNKKKLADYSNQTNQNRIILAQALIKAYNENQEMLQITINECNKKFDGDINTLCYDLFKVNTKNNIVVNGKSINSNKPIFGEIINNYISSSLFINSEGKTINDISNKTNFIDNVLNKDPLLQVYNYISNKSNSKNIKGIVLLPYDYNEREINAVKVYFLDGTESTISTKEPPNDNYLVISTNERLQLNQFENYKKSKSNQQKLITNNEDGSDLNNDLNGPVPNPPITYLFATTYTYNQDRFTQRKILSVQNAHTPEDYNPPGLNFVHILQSKFDTYTDVLLYEDWTGGEPDVMVEELKYFNLSNPNDPILSAQAVREGARHLNGEYWEGCNVFQRCVKMNTQLTLLSSWTLGSEADYRFLFFYEQDALGWNDKDDNYRNEELNIVNKIINKQFITDSFLNKIKVGGIEKVIKIANIADLDTWNSRNDVIGYALIPINFKHGEKFRIFTRRSDAISASDLIRKENNIVFENYTLSTTALSGYGFSERGQWEIYTNRSYYGGPYSGFSIWLK